MKDPLIAAAEAKERAAMRVIERGDNERRDKMQFSLGVFPMYEDGKSGDCILETIGTAEEVCRALQAEVVNYGTYAMDNRTLDITIQKA